MRVEGEKTIIGNKVIVADDTDIGYHIIEDVSKYSRNKINWVQENIDADNQFIREEIERARSFDDGKYATIAGKGKKTVVDYLFRKLNTAKEGYRSKVALDIADYHIDDIYSVLFAQVFYGPLQLGGLYGMI